MRTDAFTAILKITHRYPIGLKDIQENDLYSYYIKNQDEIFQRGTFNASEEIDTIDNTYHLVLNEDLVTGYYFLEFYLGDENSDFFINSFFL